MRDDAKAEDLIDPLRKAFAENIRQAVQDLPAHQALQMADTLCRVQMDVLAGLRVTYRAPTPVDGPAITEAWRRGGVLQEIMSQFGISKSTAYKHHPNRSARQSRAG
jgi:hypothetical protein